MADPLTDPFAGTGIQGPTSPTAPMSLPGQQTTGGTSGGNPFTDVLQHVATWNSAFTQPMAANFTPTSNVAINNPDMPGSGTGGGGGGGGTTGGGTTGGGTTGGTGGFTPVTPPPVTPPPVNVGGTIGYVPPPAVAGQHGVQAPPMPAGTDPKIWADVDRYVRAAAAQGADYSYLYKNPNLIVQFRNWSGANDPSGKVDIVDWLKGHGYTSPLAGRSGSDTYQTWLAQRNWHGIGGLQPQPAPPPKTAPPPVQPPPDTPPPPPDAPPPPPPVVPPPPPDQPPGLIFSPDHPPTNPHISPGTPPPPGNDPNANIQNLIDIFNKNFSGTNGPDIESMLNPMFGRQRQLLQQQLESSAALTPGRLGSGGFGQNEGQALSDLSGQQSATLATALEQQQQAKMQQNTAIMQLATQSGMQKYVADLNADVTKYGINTNADLQKYLDSQDNVLKKYGIDTQDVMERYKADLALKGEQYSADRSVDAAGLHAAAAEAAANAATAASQANAQLQYQLGLQGLDVTRENNIGNFVLGLLGLGNADASTINGILQGLPGGLQIVQGGGH